MPGRGHASPRRARALLQHLGIKKRIVSYYDAVEAERTPALLEAVREGESIALISDAGTPLVSDPGYRLVHAAAREELPVVSVPGASAPLALLACAGLSGARFSFLGFLPPRRSARRAVLEEVRERPDTLVFFETGRRLAESLSDMAEVLGAREAAIGRELTKKFEEVVRGDLPSLVERFADAAPARGELVLAVAGADSSEAPSEALLDRALEAHLDEGQSVSAAARAVASELGLPRRRVYARALELRGERPQG